MNGEFHIPDEEDVQLFFKGKRSERMPFVLNDTVVIKAGEQKGQLGWVVRLAEIEPEACYLIELCSGKGDLQLLKTEIEFHSS